LTDTDDNPVTDGEYVVTFSIWSDSISTSSPDREWISPNCTLLVVNGLFNWQLGSNENLPTWTMTNHADLWLGIQVESDPEIAPRTRLCSAPYAYKAWQADYAGYADSAGVALSGDGDWTVEGSNVYRLTGSVGIGTDSPAEVLEVVGNAQIDGNLTWQPKTSYLSVPASAFCPGMHSETYYNYHFLETSKMVGAEIFRAPVSLPHGATVTKVTSYWDDETDLSNSTIWLFRNQMTFSVDTMATDSTFGDLGYIETYDDSIDFATINNSTYSYYLYMWHYPDIRCYGVIIEYEFEEAY
jgi:hypothetical protein